MIRRKILIGVLALGTVAGYAMGFHSLKHRCGSHHDAWEKHVAEVCVGAAQDLDAKKANRTEPASAKSDEADSK